MRLRYQRPNSCGPRCTLIHHGPHVFTEPLQCSRSIRSAPGDGQSSLDETKPSIPPDALANHKWISRWRLQHEANRTESDRARCGPDIDRQALRRYLDANDYPRSGSLHMLDADVMCNELVSCKRGSGRRGSQVTRTCVGILGGTLGDSGRKNFRSWWIHLLDGTLRMNARARIHGLVTNRAANPCRDRLERGMKVPKAHQVASRGSGRALGTP